MKLKKPSILKSNNMDKKEIMNYISHKVDNSEWVFLSKDIIGNKMKTCFLASDKMQGLYCIMHWLKSEPELWDNLKETIDKSNK